MNHHEIEGEQTEKECCGAGCCDTGMISPRAYRAGMILQWVFLGGAFVCSLLTLVLLPKLIKREIVAEQAMKAGWIENYDRLNKEIYDAPEYKERMKQEVEMFIQQSKAQMQMEQSGNEQQVDPSMMPVEEQTGTMATWATWTGK